MTAHPVHINRYGTFENNVFDNGRIKYEIHGLNAEIHTHFGSILVKDVHPEIWINDNGWEKIKYKEIRFFNYTSNGTHRVVVEAEHEGKIYSYMAIVYEEKLKFSLYRPLFPKLFITFNKTMQYKVKMVLKNIKINHFLIIDNGTGYTEPPFKKGHRKYEMYNGTIKRNKEFRAWQDIVIGYSEGKKKFGLNWEKYKGVYRNLKFEKGDSGINMEVESDPQEINENEVKTLGFPIPDTGGGGGGSGGGGTPPADTDGDGAKDNEEYQQQTDPRNSDTDGDGMSDGYEIHYGKPSGGWQEPNWYNHRYAVIIVGGGYDFAEFPDGYMDAFWNDGKAMYYKLVNDYNYKPSEVYLMSSLWYHYISMYVNAEGDVYYFGTWGGHNPTTDSIVDGEAMWDSPTHYDVKDALDDIGDKITIHDSLFIVFITHGGYTSTGHGFLELRAHISDEDAEKEPEEQEAAYDYDYFGEYINNTFGNSVSNRKYAVMTIVIQACHSGAALKHLYGDHRIIISATKSDENSYTEIGGFDHWAFLYQSGLSISPNLGFVLSMGDLRYPHSIYQAFKKGQHAAQNNGWLHDSNPQIDDDFNGLSSQDGDTDDGTFAKKICL